MYSKIKFEHGNWYVFGHPAPNARWTISNVRYYATADWWPVWSNVIPWPFLPE